jgi:hypothetical protein
LARMTFGGKRGGVRGTTSSSGASTQRSIEDVVRQMKKEQQKPPGEDYRERALAIHGLICARCGKEFSAINRGLLTVHHKDGNHFNNPPDGSNWENLCVYCHEDVHSRSILGEYLDGSGGGKEDGLVYQDGRMQTDSRSGFGTLADHLKNFLQKNKP